MQVDLSIIVDNLVLLLFLRQKKKPTQYTTIAWAFYFSLYVHCLYIKESGIPKGIRTPVTAVKGRCPRPLDDRDTELT